MLENKGGIKTVISSFRLISGLYKQLLISWVIFKIYELKIDHSDREICNIAQD
jgi:hypothetical protein